MPCRGSRRALPAATCSRWWRRRRCSPRRTPPRAPRTPSRRWAGPRATPRSRPPLRPPARTGRARREPVKRSSSRAWSRPPVAPRSPQGRLYEGSGELGGLSPQDLESAYKIPLTGRIRPDGRGGRRLRLSQGRSRPGRIPSALRPAALHESQRLLQEAQPAGPGTEIPRRQNRAGTSSRRSTSTWSRPPARPVTCSWWRPKTKPPTRTTSPNRSTRRSTPAPPRSPTATGCPMKSAGCSWNARSFASDYSHPGVFINAASGDHGYDNFYSPFFAIAAVSGRPVDAVGDRRHQPLEGGERPRMVRAGVERTEPAKWAPAAAAARSPPSRAGRKTKAARVGWATTSSAVAAVETPVSVYASAEEGWTIVGGTSASSPLIAGIVAHESESRALAGRTGLLRRPRAAVRRHRRQQRDLHSAGEPRVLLHRARSATTGPPGSAPPTPGRCRRPSRKSNPRGPGRPAAPS